MFDVLHVSFFLPSFFLFRVFVYKAVYFPCPFFSFVFSVFFSYFTFFFFFFMFSCNCISYRKYRVMSVFLFFLFSVSSTYAEATARSAPPRRTRREPCYLIESQSRLGDSSTRSSSRLCLKRDCGAKGDCISTHIILCRTYNTHLDGAYLPSTAVS